MNPFDKFKEQELTQTKDTRNWFQKGLDYFLPKKKDLTSEELSQNLNVTIPFTGGRVASLGFQRGGQTFYDESGEKISNKQSELVSGAGSLAASYYTKFAEFIPKAAVSMYEEIKSFGESKETKLSPTLSYLMGGEETYKNINKTIEENLNRGDGVLAAYIGAISQKTLDVTVGASVFSRGMASLNKILTKGDFVSKIEAWKTLGSPKTLTELNNNFKQLSQQVYPRTIGADDSAFKIISNAKKVIDDSGLPGVLGIAKEKLAQYAELIGRETKLTDPIWKLNLYINKLQPSNLGLTGLPGYAPMGGAAQPKIGLQIQPVEPVGFKKQEDKNLLVVHNLSEQKLRFADRIGGLSNPSTAVINPNVTPFENYGDISLVGDKNLIEGEKTRLSDAYTARFPSVHSSMSYTDFDKLKADIAPYEKETGDTREIYQDDSDMIRQIENSPAIALKFLKENKITPSTDGYSYYHSQIQKAGLDGKFQVFLDDLYKKYNLQEKLFAGYTNSGQRRYKPVTIDEASKIMGKQKDEGYNYGLGSIRSKIAPVKTTSSAIKKEAGRLISKENFEVIKKSYDDELFNLKDKLSEYAVKTSDNQFIESDNQLNAIGELLMGQKDSMYYFRNKFPNAPQNIVDEVIAFRNELKKMPTEYFETKFKRPVKLSEFKIALVPDTITPEAKAILEKQGLEVREYAKGEKAKAMQDLLKSDLAFKKPIFSKLDRVTLSNEQIKDIVRTELADPNMRVIFTDELINGIATGQFEQTSWGKAIKLYEEEGKSGLLTALHEVKHDLISQLGPSLKAEALVLAKKEISPLERLRIKTSDKTLTEDGILEEYIADKWAKTTAKEKYGYKQSTWEKIYDTLDRLFNRIVDTYRKIKSKINAFIKEAGGSQKGAIRPFDGVSEADRLISEGKIRVKRVGTRDVYQYQKGNEWVNARDESSAVAQVTKSSVSKKIELPVEVQNERIALEIRKEALASSPFANKDNRFLVDKEGRVRELGDTTGKLSQKIEDMMREANVEDPREYSKGLEAYLEDVKNLKSQEEYVKGLEQKTKSIIEQEQKLQKSEKIQPYSQEELESFSQIPEAQLSVIDKETPANKLKEIQERYKSDIPYSKIIIDTNTPVKEKVGLIDYLRTPDRVLQKIGLGNIAKELRTSYESYLRELPQQLKVITDWSKRVSKDGNVKIFKWLDGQKEISLTSEELKVAEEIKQYLKEWANELNLPDDNQITHYITHIFEIGEAQKEFDEEVAKIIKDKVPGSVYDPFLEKRLGAKGYVEDTWRALDAYVKRAVRKSNMDDVLAKMKKASANLEDSQLEYVSSLGARINLRPTEWDNLLDNTIKQLVGYRLGQRPTALITSTLRKAVYRGALGLNLSSAIKNLTQGVNTFAKLGTRYTLTGYLKMLRSGAGKELEDVGVLQESFIEDRTLSAVKQTLQKIDTGLFVMFQLAEKINRGSAYFGAKSKAINSGLTEEQAIEYAKKLVRDTQFVFGSIDTPLALQSDIARTLTQFGSFSVKQTEFLLSLANKKEYAGLIRYILGSLAIVYGVGSIFNIKGENFNPLNYFARFGTPPSLALPVEIFKAVFNVPNDFGQVPSLQTKLKNLTYPSLSLVPAGIQLNKIISGLLQDKSVWQSLIGGKTPQKTTTPFDKFKGNSSKTKKVNPFDKFK